MPWRDWEHTSARRWKQSPIAHRAVTSCTLPYWPPSNIADDYFRSLDGRADDERHVLDRMLAIEAMVDRAVGDARATGDRPEPPKSSP